MIKLQDIATKYRLPPVDICFSRPEEF